MLHKIYYISIDFAKLLSFRQKYIGFLYKFFFSCSLFILKCEKKWKYELMKNKKNKKFLSFVVFSEKTQMS